MKPNFALVLAYDGIELCHRAPGGWLSVGTVAFDRPDLDAAIDALLAEARRLAPEGVATKLIVPESEVRYATVLAPGPTDEARRYQIEAEVEGLTPYPIGDLAYDWVVEGDHAQVAIVARETLREAEEFAAERGFNPVSFVARPEGGQFLGEPFFGQSATARAVLKAGDSVQPDAEAVRITGKAVVPAAPPAPAAAPPAAPRREAPPDPRQNDARQIEARQTGARPIQPPPPPLPAAPAASAAARPAPQRRVDIPQGRPPAAPAPAAPSEAPVPTTAAEPARTSLGVPPVAIEAGRKVGDLVRRMGTRLRREQAEAAAQPVATAVTARAMPVRDEGVQAEPAEAAVVAFASRRAAGGGGPPSRAIPPGPPPGRNAPAPAKPAGPGGRLAILPRDDQGTSSFARLSERGRGAVKSALQSLSMRARSAPAPAPATATATATARPATAAAGAVDPVDRRPRPVDPAIAGSRPPADPRDKATEAEALTLFGRRGQVQPQRSLAGPVLMVAGGVVALLAAVAVWALYLGGPSSTQVAGLPPATADSASAPAPAETAAIVPPAPAIAAPAPVEPAPSEPAPAAQAEAVVPPEPAAADPAPAQTAAAPEPVAETAADPAPVETDPAVLAERLALEALAETPAAEVIDRLSPAQPAAPAPVPEAEPAAQAQATPAPQQPAPERPQVAMAAPSGLLSLPGRLTPPPQTDAMPPASPAPPPPFDVAAAAAAAPPAPAEAATEAAPPAVEAVPEPEIAVLERRPAAVPPPAPNRPAPVLDPEAPRADPALAGVRPEPRSARVRALGEAQRAAQPAEPAPAAAPAGTAPDPVQRLDQGSLDQPLVPVAVTDLAEAPPPGGVSLSLLRPLRRPTDLVPDPSQPPPSVDEPAEVVASSLLPAQRPRAFAARVEATLAAQARERERAQQAEEARRARVAAAAAAAAPQQTAARRPAPADDEEGDEAASAGPATPTSASVQESATQRRAIRPREANLIGVFGAPSSRRALVRMSNGQVVRLQVGDRFDGGQVSAIGESELRYVRSGQDRVLRIASRG